jgi:hypothetical protein
VRLLSSMMKVLDSIVGVSLCCSFVEIGLDM